MTTLTTELFSRIESSDPTFDADAVARWPAGWLDRLTGLGLLAKTTPAESVRCDACGHDHVESVLWIDVPGLPRRAFVPCPEYRSVRVDPARLDRWAVRFDRLAELIADAGGFAGGVTEVVPERVWRLGKTAFGLRSVVAYLIRGSGWADAPDLVTRTPALQTAGTAVLVPAVHPLRAVWGSEIAPPVAALTDLLELDEAGVRFDRGLLASGFPALERAAANAPTATFSTPTGAEWGDVRLKVGSEHVEITVGKVARRFHFAEVGFADGRTAAKSDRVWALLRLFAARGGTVPSRSGGGAGVPDRIKQTVATLNNRLQTLLQLDERPVQHVAKKNEYRARFSIRPAETAQFPMPTTAEWDDLSVAALADGRVEITVDAVEIGTAFDAEARASHPTASAGTVSRRYSLRELTLADEHDTPTPVGRTLLVLLRHRGRLDKSVRERDKLALRAWLGDFFGLDEPFRVEPNADLWVAKFAVP